MLVAHSAKVVDHDLRPTASDWPGRIRRRRDLPAGALPPFALDRYAGFTLLFRSIVVKAGDVENRPGSSDFFSGDGVRIPHDIWVNLVCGALGVIALLPDELALYRRHGANVTWKDPDQHSPGRIKQSLGLQVERLEPEAPRLFRYRAYLELAPARAATRPTGKRGTRRSIEAYRRYADAMERRAAAYADVRALTRREVQSPHACAATQVHDRRAGWAWHHSRDVTLGLTSAIHKGRNGRG